MQLNALKTLGIVLMIVTISFFLLFLFGQISPLVFFLGMGALGIIAYVVIPALRKKFSANVE